MPGLLDTLRQQLSGSTVQQLSNAIGADRGATQSAVTAAVPAILGSMGRTAQQPGGEEAITLAAQQHAGVLGNIAALLGSGAPDAPSAGAGVLSRILGEHQGVVQNQVVQASGLEPDQTRKLLTMLAPLALAALAHHQNQGQIQPGGLVQTLLQGENAARQSGTGGLLGLVEREL